VLSVTVPLTRAVRTEASAFDDFYLAIFVRTIGEDGNGPCGARF
jgi:hypothetical protein